ncbi:MAG: P-loop NTPase [Promethearchaeota archaeon]
MKIIASTGGKGGTGKSFIATNLSIFLASQNKKVLLMDADVENPNDHLLLGIKEVEKMEGVQKRDVFQFLPKFDPDTCIKCGECSKSCKANAIFQVLDKPPVLMEHLCNGCELCYKICPVEAISANEKVIGSIYYNKDLKFNFVNKVEEGSGKETQIKIDLLTGILNLGEVRSEKIIDEMFQFAKELDETDHYDYIIVDTSPGAHCDVEFILRNSNFAVAVTEPTPFGAHDLKRILDLSKVVNTKPYVVLNRYNMADYETEINNVLNEYGVSLLAKIPLEQKILESYAKGIPYLVYNSKEDLPGKEALLNLGEKVLEIQ